MHDILEQCNEESKKTSVTLTSEWMTRLLRVSKADRQSSAAAEVRIMIEDKEKQLGINTEDSKK